MLDVRGEGLDMDVMVEERGGRLSVELKSGTREVSLHGVRCFYG